MSLDLAVLPLANAGSFERALAIYAGDESGAPGDAGELEAYARRFMTHMATTTGPSQEIRLSMTASWAHKRGLAALDPQWGGEGKLFAPGEAYG